MVFRARQTCFFTVHTGNTDDSELDSAPTSDVVRIIRELKRGSILQIFPPVITGSKAKVSRNSERKFGRSDRATKEGVTQKKNENHFVELLQCFNRWIRIRNDFMESYKSPLIIRLNGNIVTVFFFFYSIKRSAVLSVAGHDRISANVAIGKSSSPGKINSMCGYTIF